MARASQNNIDTLIETGAVKRIGSRLRYRCDECKQFKKSGPAAKCGSRLCSQSIAKKDNQNPVGPSMPTDERLIETGDAIRQADGKLAFLCRNCDSFVRSGLYARCESEKCKDRPTIENPEALMCDTCDVFGEFWAMLEAGHADNGHDSYSVMSLSADHEPRR